MIKKILIAITVFLIISCSGKTINYNENYPLLVEAEKLNKEALEFSGNERIEYFSRSAVKFEEALQEYKLDNGYIYFNIGNAWLSAGNTGKAVLNYRRAEKRLPSNNYVRKNLAYARSTTKDEIIYSESNRILRTLFFIHYDISFKGRMVVMIVFLFMLFSCSSILLYRKSKILRNSLFVLVFISIVLTVSLITETMEKEEGVIVVDEIIPRNGDSNGYEASFTSPLHEGVEFKLISKRSNWYQIELPDGRQCWIPDYSAEFIN